MPAVLVDEDATECSAWIAQAECVAFLKSAILDAAVAEAHQHPYDPVADYLEGLRWDGQPRVATWVVDYLGVESTDYATAVGQAWLISAVARAMEPGCQADHIMVMEGPQGVGKSSAFAALASPWFAELSIDPSSKDTIGDVHGPWIIEWSEMAGLGRREAEAVKAFLTRRTDRYREPYGRITRELPRRCVFGGSTNESQYLTDPSGGRRYWPLRTGFINISSLTADRDQLWAEALAMYRDGRPWHLSCDLELLARGRQESRRQEDTWYSILCDYMGAQCRADSDPWYSTVELLKALDLPAGAQGPGTARRLSAVMAELGYTPCRRRIDGRQQRGYTVSGVEGCSDED